MTQRIATSRKARQKRTTDPSGLSQEPLMNRDELARLFGVTPGTIVRFARDGMPVAKGGGSGVQAFYLPSACVAWRIMQAEAKYADLGGLNPQAERAKKDRARAELDEQTKAIREGKLVAKADVELELGKRIGATKTKLLALPRTTAPECTRLAAQGPAAIERYLHECVNAFLTELSGMEVGP